MEIENVDVLIIGAGPSGCVSSAYLNKQGIKVKVVERSKFPRFEIGESLIPRVMDNLDEVGFIPAIEKAGFELKTCSRFLRDGVDATFHFDQKFGEGWDWTWQVPRADFDMILAEEAQRQGVEIEFQAEVTAIEFNGSDSITTVRDIQGKEKQINAKFVIDSSGYGRVLPKLLGLDAPSNLTGNSSIFTHTKDVNRPEGVEGTQITFEVLEREIWFWVIPFSNGITSIGVVGKTELIEALSPTGNADEALREAIKRSGHFTERFVNNEMIFEPQIRKNYACTVSQQFGEGYALTGNSSGFLDPVFSSGVSLATTSGLLAAKLLARQMNGEKIDWQTDFADYMTEAYEVFSTYVNEWYNGNLQTLFFHKPENKEVKEKICAVLAGYAWNKENPFVAKHKKIISNLAYTINM
ncbi:MAG TPA: NAD(P)/FAD-dependent oxidoreductase [Brumimicrobium sp.]|nr:NAD(P)/FAD-dependent oxidoreductase [Brumimicrobium sp.]